MTKINNIDTYRGFYFTKKGVNYKSKGKFSEQVKYSKGFKLREDADNTIHHLYNKLMAGKNLTKNEATCFREDVVAQDYYVQKNGIWYDFDDALPLTTCIDKYTRIDKRINK